MLNFLEEFLPATLRDNQVIGLNESVLSGRQGQHRVHYGEVLPECQRAKLACVLVDDPPVESDVLVNAFVDGDSELAILLTLNIDDVVLG